MNRSGVRKGGHVTPQGLVGTAISMRHDLAQGLTFFSLPTPYPSTRNRTPLHWAAGNGQLGVIRELLFWGARVECTDAWRKVPLHWAAFRGHVASVEELVGKGSPIDKPDSDGHIPGETFHQSVPEVRVPMCIY